MESVKWKEVKSQNQQFLSDFFKYQSSSYSLNNFFLFLPFSPNILTSFHSKLWWIFQIHYNLAYTKYITLFKFVAVLQFVSWLLANHQRLQI